MTNKPDAREAVIREAIQKIMQELKPRALAIFLRKPLLDPEYPEVSDIDITAIWTQREELPERMVVYIQGGRVFVDVLWVPVSKMLNAQEAASYKTLPHLLFESEPLYVQSETVQSVIDSIKQKTYEQAVWETRIGHQLDFGDAAFEEAKKNLDFSAAALFFLQTAHANYIVALADCLNQSTMSLLTRPVTMLKRIVAGTGLDLVNLMETNLLLDVDPSPSLSALKRVFDLVSQKCAGKQPINVSNRTLGHYNYTLSPIEIEYRLTFANALIQNKDTANANFYLRFWAYSLSRCSMVLKESYESKNPSFYVPIESLKTSIDAIFPEILADLKVILGGEITNQRIQQSIQGTICFKHQMISLIQKKGTKTKK
jgi:hypothetical protein